MSSVVPSSPHLPPSGRPSPADDRAGVPGAARPERLTAAAFLVAALGMFAYEALKSALLPALSLWESHAITIAVGAVTAAVVTHVAVRRQATAERRLAEVQARQAALAENAARYRLLVEASPEAIAVHREGRVLYVNAAARALLGLAPDAATGPAVADAEALAGRSLADFVHPDDRLRLRDGPAVPDGRVRTWRLVRADGAVVDVEAASAPLSFDGAPAVQTVVRDVTARRRLEAQLEHQAFHDALTGLANRALFRDRVTHALERAHRDAASGVAVLFLDLDDFKPVNDTLGHAAGDRLLVAVAERLRQAVRGYDTVARLGGDEFAVLLEGLHPAHAADEADLVARRIGAALRHPLRVDGRSTAVSASLGLAHATVDDDVDALLRNADVALYAAKADGKARHAVFEPAMYAALRARLELEADLRAALADPAGPEAAGFHLAFQPVVDLADERLRSLEALLRWQHPRRGAVSPGVVVPLAEETGLIVPLGAWVLRAACRQLAAWAADARAIGVHAHAVPGIAVNISGRQLEQGDLAALVADTLRETGAPAYRLTLELTESVLMRRTAESLATLEALRRLGVRIALDDFGTGYSSLAYLQRVPLDVLKIDRTFVTGLATGTHDAALVRTIVTLGHLLGVRTVAEGIEHVAQRDALRALGCDDGQGYLFDRPLDALTATARVQAAVRARTATGARHAA